LAHVVFNVSNVPAWTVIFSGPLDSQIIAMLSVRCSFGVSRTYFTSHFSPGAVATSRAGGTFRPTISPFIFSMAYAKSDFRM